MNLNRESKFWLGNKPWEHQVQAITMSHGKDGFGFFMEPGCGKTFTAINSVRLDCAKAGRMMRILVIAPVIVLENWRKEFGMFSKFDKKKVVVLHGSKRERISKLMSLGDSGVAITNYKTLGVMPEVVKALAEWGPEIMIVDECHRLKDMKSKQTKAAKKLSEISSKKYMLSGTPILNDIMDLWSQYLIMDGGRTLGKSPVAFRNTYFTNVLKHTHANFPKWVEKPGARTALMNEIKGSCIFVEKEKALDLPDLVKVTREVELSKDTKKAYKDMLKDFIAFVNEAGETPTAAVAELVLTKGLRLLQITSGFVGTQTAEGVHGVHRFKDNPKKEMLKELLIDLAPSSKVLVWSVFKENYADIRDVCEKLKINYVEVHGGKTKKEKDEAVRALNEDEDVRVLIGHPASGGIGINLVASDVSIFYSRTFSLENDIQAEARNYRGGSERHSKVTRYDIVAKDTIDAEVMKVLREKKNIGIEVLKGML